MSKINIAIVEDDKIIRNTLIELLSSSCEVDIVGSFESAEEFILNFHHLNINVVVMDINLHGLNGIECVRMLKQLNNEIQYLMYTAINDSEKTFESLKAGATGYILKKSTSDKILDCIKDISRGGSPMSPEIARMVVNTFTHKQKALESFNTFSKREQEILIALSKGYQYREIANSLFISVETVRTYIRRIYEKLQVHSKVEALNKVFPK